MPGAYEPSGEDLFVEITALGNPQGANCSDRSNAPYEITNSVRHHTRVPCNSGV
jgi:hypothetical protein